MESTWSIQVFEEMEINGIKKKKHLMEKSARVFPEKLF